MYLLDAIQQLCDVDIIYTTKLTHINEYDSETKTITINKVVPGRYSREWTVAHELGHAFFDRFKVGESIRARKLFGNFDQEYSWLKNILSSAYSDPGYGFITSYAETHPEEDFCDTFAYVVINWGEELATWDSVFNKKVQLVEGLLEKKLAKFDKG